MRRGTRTAVAQELEAGVGYRELNIKLNQLRSVVKDMRSGLREVGFEREADVWFLDANDVVNDAGKLLRRLR